MPLASALRRVHSEQRSDITDHLSDSRYRVLCGDGLAVHAVIQLRTQQIPKAASSLRFSLLRRKLVSYSLFIGYHPGDWLGHSIYTTLLMLVRRFRLLHLAQAHQMMRGRVGVAGTDETVPNLRSCQRVGKAEPKTGNQKPVKTGG